MILQRIHGGFSKRLHRIVVAVAGPVSYTHLDVYKRQTQASVKDLQGMGIWPDILVCRSELPLDDLSLIHILLMA